MEKLIKGVILAIIVTFIVCGCSKKSDKIVDITVDEFVKKIENKESFILYVGNDNCSHCVAYKPTLIKVLEDYDITAYHIDNSLFDEDVKAGEKFDEYINIDSTPTIAFITDGEEKSTLNRINGQTSYESTVEVFKNNDYIK